MTRHFKLERPLHAKYSEVKARVERSWEVLVNIPAVEDFRGGPSGQTSVIVCVAKNQHHLYQAVEQVC